MDMVVWSPNEGMTSKYLETNYDKSVIKIKVKNQN
jgi:hypothetical protein